MLWLPHHPTFLKLPGRAPPIADEGTGATGDSCPDYRAKQRPVAEKLPLLCAHPWDPQRLQCSPTTPPTPRQAGRSQRHRHTDQDLADLVRPLVQDSDPVHFPQLVAHADQA